MLTGLLVGLTWAAGGQGRADESVEPDGIERDRAALEAIYFALDGPNWVYNSNWLSDQPFNQWYGVLTDDDGRVVALVLHSLNIFGSIPDGGPSLRANELRGRIPAEIGQLDRLIGLFLSNNRLNGPIPPELGDLTELRFLRLDGNQLSGSIPTELGQLAKLRSLVLMENGLSGPIPAELGRLANLEQLFLRSNRLSGPIPAELGQLSRLQYLDLRFTGVSGAIPAQLGELSMLEGLYLAGTELSGAIPPELGRLGALRQLSLPANAGLVGPLPHWLPGLTALTTLRVANAYINIDSNSPGAPLCAPADAAFQAWLAELDEADVVDCSARTEGAPTDSPANQGADRFSGSARTDRRALVALYRATDGANWVDNTNWLSNRPLGEWYGVTTDEDGRVIKLELYTLADGVYVRSNGLRGRIPPELGRLDRLQSLVLWRNRLSGPIPAELGKLTNLERLTLSNNRLSGSIPVELGRLTKLYSLSLKDNRLSGPIPPQLGDLRQLSELFLDGNELDGSIPAELSKLGNLRSLGLARNRFSGPIPSELSRLRRLHYLNLSHNQLSGPIPPDLRRLYDLSRLFLNDNRLSGPIPGDLGYLSRLSELYLDGNPDLTGRLPASFTGLSLNTLRLGETQLCAHPGATFQSWLSGIQRRSGIVDCSTPTADADRQTLIDFYDSTGGPDWLFNTNWLSDLPLGEWYGVSTDGYGRVTGLTLYTIDGEEPIGGNGSELTGNGLSGAIPASLGQLEELRWLYVADNPGLTGALPGSLVGLEDLSGLWVNDTQLCAPVEWEFQAWLRGIEHREGATNCVAEGNLSDREALTALYHATDGPNWTISTNWLSDRPLEEWHGVTTDRAGRVTELTLYTPDWERPVDSGELRGNGLRGSIPAELGQLDRLQRLDLRNNNLSGPIPPQLGELSELRALLLDLNWLSGPIPPQVGDLSRLQRLSLSGNRLSGPIPGELGKLSELDSLHLDRNKLSEAIPIQLSHLSKLKNLRLERNRLSGAIPIELGKLTNLGRLTLSNNSLSGPIPGQLGELAELVVLYLGGNELSGPVPAELGGLRKLRQLYLSHSPDLSGPLPTSWTGLTAVRLLWVEDTPVCAPAGAALLEWIGGIERTAGLVACDPADQEHGSW